MEFYGNARLHGLAPTRVWLPLRGAPPLGGKGWLGCKPWHEGHPSVNFGDTAYAA